MGFLWCPRGAELGVEKVGGNAGSVWVGKSIIRVHGPSRPIPRDGHGLLQFPATTFQAYRITWRPGVAVPSITRINNKSNQIKFKILFKNKVRECDAATQTPPLNLHASLTLLPIILKPCHPLKYNIFTKLPLESVTISLNPPSSQAPVTDHRTQNQTPCSRERQFPGQL